MVKSPKDLGPLAETIRCCRNPRCIYCKGNGWYVRIDQGERRIRTKTANILTYSNVQIVEYGDNVRDTCRHCGDWRGATRKMPSGEETTTLPADCPDKDRCSQEVAPWRTKR